MPNFLWKMPGLLPVLRDCVTRVLSGFAAIDDYFPYPPDENEYNAATASILKWLGVHAIPRLRRRILERRSAVMVQRIVRGYLSRKALVADITMAVETHRDEIEYIELLLRRGVELTRIINNSKETILFQLNDSGNNAHLKLYTSFHSRNSYQFTICALNDVAVVREVPPVTLQLITCNEDYPSLNFVVENALTRDALIYALRMIIDKNVSELEIAARGRKPWFLLPYAAIYYPKVLPSEFDLVLTMIYRQFSTGVPISICTKHRTEKYIFRIADDLEAAHIGQRVAIAQCCFNPNVDTFKNYFTLPISEIVEIRVGKYSPVLRKMVLIGKDKCLAIVTEQRTYECITETVETRNTLVRVVRALINVKRRGLRSLSQRKMIST